MYFPQAATHQATITLDLAAVHIEEHVTGTPCRHREGLRPVICSGMAHTE
jgi:hypothetical protein